MLASLLAQTKIHSFLHKASDAAPSLDIHERVFDTNGLPEDASSQWAAGLLYAAQKQEEDHRDYIVGCAVQNRRLDVRLSHAYSNYNDEKYEKGNDWIRDTEHYYRRSMRACHKTNQLFEDMADEAYDFFDQRNWDKIAEANYIKNKDVIDEQWANGLKSWNEGVYFNAGMFYGRVWYYLAYGQYI